MQENKAVQRPGWGLELERAALKWVMREGISKKVMLEQTPEGEAGSWRICRVFSAEAPAGAKFLGVQSRQEACMLPVWLELGEWVVDNVREIACMVRVVVVGQGMWDLIGH